MSSAIRSGVFNVSAIVSTPQITAFISASSTRLCPPGKRWGRKVSDYAFSEFVGILRHRLNKTGGQLHEVDRYFPSSKTCSRCGHVVKELALDIRQWECPACGTMLDRDENAAMNILVEGMKYA